MSSLQLEIAALSRPFSLGMLYTARNDKLITDFTIWDREIIEKKRTKQIQTSSEFEVTTSDSLQSKSSLLDVNVSLNISFLSGLIEIGGSASYLKDNKKLKNQCRITLQYKATTFFERLALTLQEAQTEQVVEVIKNYGATHIVTGILYGTNAFFVFDSEKLESSSVQTIEAKMEAAMKKIPFLSFEAKASTKLSDEEHATANRFSCKFYGDLVLDRNPTTFEDAVKTYSKLPELLGENGENSVPVKVWLTPLKNLIPSAAELKGNISDGLLRQANNVLEGMREAEMRYNEALEEDWVEYFPQIQKRLRCFQHLCEDYTTMLSKIMQKNILLIRDGKEDETSMKKLFDDQEKTPFCQENLCKWLDNAEREINVVRSCMDILKGIEIVQDKSELDRVVLSAGIEEVFCFVFTSMETNDPYLDQMTDYLRSDVTQTPAKVTPPSKDHWFFSHEVFKTMIYKAKEFTEPARRLKKNRFRFVVAALPNDKFKGATIYQYKDHCLKTEDFTKPVSDVTTITDKRVFSWYGTNLTLDVDTAYETLVLSQDNKKATWDFQDQKYPETPERFNTFPQVLCKEGLTGRHYFEIEWSINHYTNVGVGLAYSGTARKVNFENIGTSTVTETIDSNGDIHGECKTVWKKDSKNIGFAQSDVSWYFGIDENNVKAWHNDMCSNIAVPYKECSRIGVYLDWPGGTLSFYKVSSNNLTHLHTFRADFTEPLYPGLYVLFTYAVFSSID